MQKFLAALALLGSALGAQAASSDLLGTYAIKDKGQLKEAIKVSQDSGAVVISEKQKNGSR